MSEKTKVYGIADKAWQPVVGCDPHMPCAPRCWARRTVARIVECQKTDHTKRAEFFQIALTPDGRKWSGEVFLDEAHLLDPMKWRKSSVVATGFHGDWGRLSPEDMATVLAVMSQCPEHTFMPLTKQPDRVADFLKWDFVEDEIDAAGTRLGWCHANASGRIPLPNVSIGCSVMNQAEADKLRPYMDALSALGWRTHVWYEPALGPVDWTGWGFIELLITGGESGHGARPFDVAWGRANVRWCRNNGIRCFVKQLGANPIIAACRQNHYDFGDEIGRKARFSAVDPMHESTGMWRVHFEDRKGGDPSEWPEDLRVREMPEVSR